MTVDGTERGWGAAGEAGGGETEVAGWVRQAREGDLAAGSREGAPPGWSRFAVGRAGRHVHDCSQKHREYLGRVR